MLVHTDRTYTYEIMKEDLENLQKAFPELINIRSLGKTKWGRDIFLVSLGFGSKNVLFSASHHAREWLTTMVNMKMIEQYAKAYTEGKIIGEFDVKAILDKTTICFVPMVNPDGVALQQQGLAAYPESYHQTLLKMNDGCADFSRWKANAEGIDLNRQYPAKWDSIKSAPLNPSYKNYKGEFPLQAIEASIMYDLTYELNPTMVVAYHTAGQELFWHFHTKKENYERDFHIASTFCKLTGYQLIEPEPDPSGGGYKDWFIQEFDRPGLTPELAVYPGERNVDIKHFQEEWERNKEAGLFLADVVS